MTMTQFQNHSPLAAPDQVDKSLASFSKGGNNATDQVKVTAVTHWTDKLFPFRLPARQTFGFNLANLP